MLSPIDVIGAVTVVTALVRTWDTGGGQYPLGPVGSLRQSRTLVSGVSAALVPLAAIGQGFYQESHAQAAWNDFAANHHHKQPKYRPFVAIKRLTATITTAGDRILKHYEKQNDIDEKRDRGSQSIVETVLLYTLASASLIWVLQPFIPTGLDGKVASPFVQALYLPQFERVGTTYHQWASESSSDNFETIHLINTRYQSEYHRDDFHDRNPIPTKPPYSWREPYNIRPPPTQPDQIALHDLKASSPEVTTPKVLSPNSVSTISMSPERNNHNSSEIETLQPT